MEKLAENDSISGQRMLKWSMLILLLVNAVWSIAFSDLIETEGWVDVSVKLQVQRAVLFGVMALLLGLTLYVWLGRADRVLGWLKTFISALSRLRWGLLLPMAALAVAFPILMFGPLSTYFAYNWALYAVFAWLAVLLAACIMALWQKPWIDSLAVSSVSLAVIYNLTTYFPHVTSYPFSLWWSETTRFYMGSTFFAERLYGHDLPWVTMHLTRYLIQAFPFLAPDSPLWVHRLWQAGLRFTFPFITGILAARYFKLSLPKGFWVFAAWAGLYFFQGPVFYHLIVIVMLVFLLVQSRRFWRTLLVVTLISVYAGFSRINWVPMAGLMAAVLYFMDTPVPSGGWRSAGRYLLPPVSWVLVGTAVGFAAQQFWVINSGSSSGWSIRATRKSCSILRLPRILSGSACSQTLPTRWESCRISC